MGNKKKHPLFMRLGMTGIFTATTFAGGVFAREQLAYRTAKKHNIAPTDPNVFFADLPCGTVSYKKTGYGVPLLLLHDFYNGANHKEWDYVQKRLSQSYTVYALDFIGFGNSEKIATPGTAYLYSRCVSEFLEHVITKKAYVVGSTGGGDMAMIASKWAEQYIEKLVLVSPKGFHHTLPSPHQASVLKKLLQPFFGTLHFLNGTEKRKLQRELECKFFAKEKLKKWYINEAHTIARLSKNSKFSYATIASHFWNVYIIDTFAKTTIPYAIFWGEENEENPLLYLEKGKDLRDDGVFVSFEKTGTFPHIENPQGFATALIDFLLD
ncbi:MAG: alpha/beta hydrolase [Bacillota bacterium]